jgi:hypothetical protein
MVGEKILKLKFPPKTKHFMWLLLHNKSLSQDKLQKIIFMVMAGVISMGKILRIITISLWITNSLRRFRWRFITLYGLPVGRMEAPLRKV